MPGHFIPEYKKDRNGNILINEKPGLIRVLSIYRMIFQSVPSKRRRSGCSPALPYPASVIL